MGEGEKVGGGEVLPISNRWASTTPRQPLESTEDNPYRKKNKGGFELQICCDWGRIDVT
jgi:hypothetical protein